MAPGIHDDCTADRSRDTDVELETTSPGGGTESSQARQGDTGPGCHHTLMDRYVVEGADELDRQTGETGIGDDDIGTATEHEQRQPGVSVRASRKHQIELLS